MLSPSVRFDIEYYFFVLAIHPELNPFVLRFLLFDVLFGNVQRIEYRINFAAF